MAAAEESKPRHRRGPLAKRAYSIAVHRIPKHQLETDRVLYPESETDRLEERARRLCANLSCRARLRELGWCPRVGCKHHLFLDVNPATGSIKLNFPNLEPWQLKHPCVLELVTIEQGDAHGQELTLEEVGRAMNITRERVRQLELRGLKKLRDCDEAETLRDSAPDDHGERLWSETLDCHEGGLRIAVGKAFARVQKKYRAQAPSSRVLLGEDEE